jgi:N-6 DNA Methylase
VPLISRERLFHPRVIKEKLSAWRAPTDLEARRQALASWVERIKEGNLQIKKETSLDKLFVGDIFEKVLGYAHYNKQLDGRYTCAIQERTSPGGTVDAALGYFYTDRSRLDEETVMVPIEAKDGKDDLDRPSGSKTRSPVQQLFDYLNDCGQHARFGILTNFQEIRLYSRQMGWARYEVFRTKDLFEKEGELKRFIYIMRPESLLWRGLDTPPLATDLLSEGEVVEQDITRRFYATYKEKREALFAELERNNPEVDRTLILEKTQKILDRVLFIFFAEDRGLLPAETYRNQMSRQMPGMRDWTKLSALFSALDKGDTNIHKYNGKLFELDRELEALFIAQEVKSVDFGALADYNFESEVSVRVLGHVLEQSISDIEEKKALFQNVKLEKGGKRKRDGVYYTPPFITSAIVEHCIGGWLDARQAEIEAAQPGNELAQLLALRDQLDSVSVLDPACGSGAFLVEALQYLTERHLDLDARIKAIAPECAFTPAELGMEQAILKGNGAEQPSSKRMDLALARRVLERNLCGVDINAESVEITKLSLWLQTAEHGYFLSDLSPSIRVGDSLIPDPAVSKLAFDWPAGFKKVMARGGFDVIIGNPPYVKLQTFRRLMPKAAEYLRANYKSCQSGNFDMYLPFIEKGIDLLHPQGLMGYIAPSLWLKNDYGRG